MNKDKKKGPLVLLTINSWGVSPLTGVENNAIRKAGVLEFKDLVSNFPSTIIKPYSDKLSENYQVLASGVRPEKNLINNFSISKLIDYNNLIQLKIADSENFPLLSVIFNSQEDKLANEDWEIVGSDGFFSDIFFNIDDKISNRLLASIKSSKYDFILANFCEAGRHALRGDFEQTVLSIKKNSINLKKIAKATLSESGTLIILGAYGLAEEIFNYNTKMPYLKRNLNPVPFLIINKDYQGRSIGFKEAPNNDISLLEPNGSFLDVAPTILNLLNLDIPEGLEGESFLKE